MPDITIKTLHTRSEMDAAVELQQIYWGEDMAAIVPTHMLLSIANYGGHVHGAFDGNTMVGMLLGFLGADIDPNSHDDAPSRILIMSKRMVVLPEYRSQKIGERLKLAQRDYAIQHNIQLVTWTFDPLLSRNAYLNLHKLAGTGQHYEIAYFGEGASHPTLSGDRLVVNWWVNHPQTVADLNFQRPNSVDTAHKDFVQFNKTKRNTAGYPVPSSTTEQDLTFPRVGFEIPSDFVTLENNDAQLAKQWREHIQQSMPQLFEAGYIATDFALMKATVDADYTQSYYIFTKDDDTYQFNQPHEETA